MTEIPPPTGHRSASVAADDFFQLRREDLAVLAAAYLRDSRAPRQWAGVVGGLGGLALGPLLIALGTQLGWSARLEPYLFVGGWAIMLAFGAIVWRRERALRQRYQLRCPSCDALLLNGLKDQSGFARVELIITTGTCPHCGSQVLAP